MASLKRNLDSGNFGSGDTLAVRNDTNTFVWFNIKPNIHMMGWVLESVLESRTRDAISALYSISLERLCNASCDFRMMWSFM
jgi:hypothetical protein